jgi:hypothetical protein
MSEKQAEAEDQPTKKKHFKEQFDGEETLLVFRKHPIVMRKGLILAAFGMLVGPLYTLILTYFDKSSAYSNLSVVGPLVFQRLHHDQQTLHPADPQLTSSQRRRYRPRSDPND